MSIYLIYLCFSLLSAVLCNELFIIANVLCILFSSQMANRRTQCLVEARKWFHAKHRSKRGKKPLLLSVFGSAFGDERCARTNRHVGELHGFIVRVDRFSDGSHGSLPWLAWLAWLACMTRMARTHQCLKYRCFQTATCLILSNHFFPLGYPFEKILIRSNGSGYPFEKEFVDRSSD